MFLVPGPARCGGFHPGKNELEIKRIDHQSERVVATEAAYISDHDSERSRNIYIQVDTTVLGHARYSPVSVAPSVTRLNLYSTSFSTPIPKFLVRLFRG